jgi:hypothetical protein
MRRDPVTPETRDAVLQRDGGCVGPRIGLPGACYGRIEIDHVRASGGLQLRSPSTLENLACLCSTHHRYKTEHGREVRPLLIAWIAARVAA